MGDVKKKEAPVLQTIAWAVVIAAGWAGFAWMATVMPGGMDVAWTWVRALPMAAQLALWLLLLPWMAALWLSQTALAPWLRWVLIAGLALATLWSALPPVFASIGRGRQ